MDIGKSDLISFSLKDVQLRSVIINRYLSFLLNSVYLPLSGAKWDRSIAFASYFSFFAAALKGIFKIQTKQYARFHNFFFYRLLMIKMTW